MDFNFGFIKDNNIYLGAFLDFPERKIGEVKDSEEKTVEYFQSRFEDYYVKVMNLKKTIEESENQGSFLMKIKHLKSQMNTIAAIGDFKKVHNELTQLENTINQKIEANRTKNTLLKKGLIEELKQIVSIENWKETFETVKDIQQRWMKTGRVNQDEERIIETEFRALIDRFFEEKKRIDELQKELQVARKVAYEKLIEKVSALKTRIEDADALQRLQTIQKEWKDLPGIPSSSYKELLKTFSDASKEIWSAIKDSEKQLFSREELFKEVETLAKNPTLKEIKAIQDKWKSLKLKSKKDFELNRKFNAICDLIYEKIRLEKIVQKDTYKDYSEKEKLKLKISLMKKFIDRDEKEIQQIETSPLMERVSSGNQKNVFDKQLRYKKLKIEAKKKLLRELKEDYIE